MFLGVDDSRDCENNPSDERVAHAEISRITPKIVELTFLKSLPHFVNEEFTIKRGSKQEYYLTVDKGVELERRRFLKGSKLLYKI